VIYQSKISGWKRLLCRFCCPNWHDERPKVNEPGPWVAVAIIQTHRGEFERCVRFVDNDLLNAYEVARWLALDLADRTHSELGVRWAVRRPEQGNDSSASTDVKGKANE
jgi:hypothetical protein